MAARLKDCLHLAHRPPNHLPAELRGALLLLLVQEAEGSAIRLEWGQTVPQAHRLDPEHMARCGQLLPRSGLGYSVSWPDAKPRDPCRMGNCNFKVAISTHVQLIVKNY